MNMPQPMSNDPESRRFVWRNLDAYLAGKLEPAEHQRFEAILRDCPASREYVSHEREFAELVKRAANQPVECPEGLKARVAAALQRCEVEPVAAVPAPEATLARVHRYPIAATISLLAASLLFAAALLFYMGRTSPTPQPMVAVQLTPVVAQLSLETRADRCRYRAAESEYKSKFADGPVLPREFCGSRCKIADYKCDESGGRSVMCAVYQTPDGETFALLTFKRNPDDDMADMQAIEYLVGEKRVLLWREGEYYRALIGKPADHSLHRRMEAIRRL